MSVSLRVLRHIDLAEAARLHAACFPDEAWDSAALATVLAMAGTEGMLACAATGEARGLLIGQHLGEDAEILTLGVAPTARRHGVARALLSAFIAQSRAAGAMRVVLEVAADNAAALALYETLGFTRRGTRPNYYRRQTGPSMDAWRFGLDISSQKRP
jgi:ribosomal protein S18 acetylase RimI-like enzyme